MSITISILSRPISETRATPAQSLFTAALPAGLGQKLAGMSQRRAERRMMLAIEELGHPGVLADCQRATRN
jgi:hypothetical protein